MKSKQRTTEAVIGSAPLLFAYGKNRFSHDVTDIEVYEDDECILDCGYTNYVGTCFQNCSSISSCTGFIGYTYEFYSYFDCVLFCIKWTYYMYAEVNEITSKYGVVYVNHNSYFNDENCAVDIDYQHFPNGTVEVTGPDTTLFRPNEKIMCGSGLYILKKIRVGNFFFFFKLFSPA